jgi:hypothetical protein
MAVAVESLLLLLREDSSRRHGFKEPTFLTSASDGCDCQIQLSWDLSSGLLQLGINSEAVNCFDICQDSIDGDQPIARPLHT